MPNLLALSRELRDLIYFFVLKAPDDPPPSSPANSGERQQAEDGPHHACKIYYQRRMHVSSAALLLTSRQIHAEFAASVARWKKSGPLRYKLDCMLYEEEAIYPTWLSVPVISERIDLLEVELRLFGDPEVNEAGFMNAWDRKKAHNDQSPIFWGLCALLQRFTMCGPEFLSCEKGQGVVEVKRLVLNFIDDYRNVESEIAAKYRRRKDIMHGSDVYSIIRSAIMVMYEPGSDRNPAFERMQDVILMLNREDGDDWLYELCETDHGQ